MLDPLHLHQSYDGPIPQAALAVIRFGFPETVALIRARGEAAFFRSMVSGQIRTIRARRADGTFYPALLADLKFYREQLRSWSSIAAKLGWAIDGALAPFPRPTKRSSLPYLNTEVPTPTE